MPSPATSLEEGGSGGGGGSNLVKSLYAESKLRTTKQAEARKCSARETTVRRQNEPK